MSQAEPAVVAAPDWVIIGLARGLVLGAIWGVLFAAAWAAGDGVAILLPALAIAVPLGGGFGLLTGGLVGVLCALVTVTVPPLRTRPRVTAIGAIGVASVTIGGLMILLPEHPDPIPILLFVVPSAALGVISLWVRPVGTVRR